MNIHCIGRRLNNIYIYKRKVLSSLNWIPASTMSWWYGLYPFVGQNQPLCQPPYFYTVRIHQYEHPLHWKGLKRFIYIYKKSVFQSEVDPSLKHVVVVCFCTYLLPRISQSATLPGWDTVRIHPYVHPLHQKGLEHFIHI